MAKEIEKMARLEARLEKLAKLNAELTADLQLQSVRLQMAEEMGSLAGWKYFYATNEFYVSDEALNLFDHVVPNRFSAADYLKLVHPDDLELILERLRTPRVNDIFRLEHRIILNGRVRYIHTKTIRKYVEDESAVIEGYLQDMTASVERRREIDTLRRAVDMANEEIYAFRTDGRMLFANKLFHSRYRLDADITRYSITDISPRFDRIRLAKLIEDITRNKGSMVYTSEHLMPDGTLLPLEVSCYVKRESHDKNVVWAFARDLSTLVSQERNMRGTSRLLQTMLENLPTAVFVKDTADHNKYVCWSSAMERLTGIPARDAIGRTDQELFPSQSAATLLGRDDASLSEGVPVIEYTDSLTTAGTPVAVKIFKTAVRIDDREPLILGLIEDISSMDDTLSEHIRARIAAEQSDRLKSAFLANMSHEIRTPLNAIVGFTKLVAETDDTAERSRYHSIIRENADLLSKSINNILDVSNIEAGTIELMPTPVSIAELCRGAVATHQQFFTPGVELSLSGGDESLTCVCDPDRLMQVISNLLSNAAKFTSAGKVTLSFRAEGDHIAFTVEDTGLGIPADKLEIIFDRFVQLDESFPGTGLGLPIAKMLVGKMGGTIHAESRPGQGTRILFTIAYIPVTTSAGNAQPSVADQARDDRRRTILVAEDVDSNYLLIEALIGRNYDLIRAHNGAEAVELYKECNPDAILMDVKMPVMNGITATIEIRKLSPTVPIIALTAFAFTEDRLQLLNAGCDDYLTKPVSLELLRSLLTKYL